MSSVSRETLVSAPLGQNLSVSVSAGRAIKIFISISCMQLHSRERSASLEEQCHPCSLNSDQATPLYSAVHLYSTSHPTPYCIEWSNAAQRIAIAFDGLCMNRAQTSAQGSDCLYRALEIIYVDSLGKLFMPRSQRYCSVSLDYLVPLQQLRKACGDNVRSV
jgi:hypothetical protein